MCHSIVAPSLGESVQEMTVISIKKKKGDSFRKDDVLVVVETDKASQHIYASEDGSVLDVLHDVDDLVAPGTVLMKYTTQSVPSTNTQPDEYNQQKTESTSSQNKSLEPILMPAAQKILDAGSIQSSCVPSRGTGRSGRITKRDISREYQKENEKLNEPSVETGYNQEKGARIEPMSSMRAVIAKRLKKAQNECAILTTFNTVDMSTVMKCRERYQERFKKEYGFKLGFMSFFVKASVHALQLCPEVHATIEGQNIRYFDRYDISVAVGIEKKGLVVPVVRDCNKKSFASIESDIKLLASKAREGKLSPQDMMGGSFTISNGGVYGSLMSTPIINPPQSSILGMHRIEKTPVVRDDAIVIRPIMYLALSYDHRLIDGRQAVLFLSCIKDYIEDPIHSIIFT